MLAYVKGFSRMTEQEQYEHLTDVHGEEPEDGDDWSQIHDTSHEVDEHDHRHTV